MLRKTSPKTPLVFPTPPGPIPIGRTVGAREGINADGSPETRHASGSRLTRWFAGLTAFIAALGLLGYVPGMQRLGSIRGSYIPMAPSTALCFLILAAILLATTTTPRRLRARISAVAAAVVLLFGVLEVLGYLLDLDLNLEDAIMPRAGSLGAVPIARMSPLTGVGFAIAGISVLLLVLRPSGDRTSGRVGDWAGVIGGGAALTGATVLLGYLYDTPLMYGTGTIPMAATTAIGFLFLGIASIAAAGRSALPWSTFAGTSSRARLLRAFVPLTTISVLLVVTWNRWISVSIEVNDALVSAALAVLVAGITAAVAVYVARSVGGAMDRAEEERRRNEEENAALVEQLHHSQKMETVGRLAGGVAHDFNNILTVIIAYAGMLSLTLPHDSRARADVIEIRKAADRAARLTKQLLGFSRKQVIAPEVLQINEAIAESRNMLRTLVGEHIELELRVADDLPAIEIDPAQLDQILMNLVANARDAMPQGGTLTIETERVQVEKPISTPGGSLAPGDYALVRVSDDGHGMDEETTKHIFEPFYSTKSRGQGTGLGLATVYGIVDQNRGGIVVRSRPGEGTTFGIYLPATSKAPRVVRLAEVAAQPAGQATILLVEDDRLVRTVTRRILEQEGFVVLEAADGEMGCEVLEQYKEEIHLLLTDVIMPNLGGKAVHDRALTLRPEIKTLFMSGYTDAQLDEQGVLDRDTELLEKPFTGDELTRRVWSVLRGRARSSG